MSDVPAWCALALSVANTGYLGARRFRSQRHVRAAGPVAVTRSALAEARDAFQHIITESGVYTAWFLTDPRPLRSEPLEDLAKRTADETLADMIRELGAQCRKCYALAPTKPGPRVYSLGGRSDSYPSMYSDEDAEVDRKQLDLVEAARTGRDAADAALDRLNLLESRI